MGSAHRLQIVPFQGFVNGVHLVDGLCPSLTDYAPAGLLKK
jgi:hypothetical protein